MVHLEIPTAFTPTETPPPPPPQWKHRKLHLHNLKHLWQGDRSPMVDWHQGPRFGAPLGAWLGALEGPRTELLLPKFLRCDRYPSGATMEPSSAANHAPHQIPALRVRFKAPPWTDSPAFPGELKHTPAEGTWRLRSTETAAQRKAAGRLWAKPTRVHHGCSIKKGALGVSIPQAAAPWWWGDSVPWARWGRSRIHQVCQANL